MSKPRLTSRVVRGLDAAIGTLRAEHSIGTFDNVRSRGRRKRGAAFAPFVRSDSGDVGAAIAFLEALVAWHDDENGVEVERVEEPKRVEDPPFPRASMTDTRAEFLVVYTHPIDYPGRFVVRRWSLVEGTLSADLVPVAVVRSLEDARVAVAAVAPSERVRIPRHDHDDPVIVETWIW